MKSNVELRQKNMLTLLRTVRDYGPIQKRQLQSITGLSWGTVSTMTAELMENGYLQIAGKQSTDVGRRPDMLDISDRDQRTCGAEFCAAPLHSSRFAVGTRRWIPSTRCWTRRWSSVKGSTFWASPLPSRAW